MKRILTLVAFGAALSLGAAAFQSQTNIEIPFAFKMGGQVFPAGTYSVQRAAQSGLLLIRSVEGRSFLVPVQRTGAYHEQRGAHMVFRSVDGKEQVLTELWTGNAGQGYLLRSTK
jgi:hypothetical protein